MKVTQVFTLDGASSLNLPFFDFSVSAGNNGLQVTELLPSSIDFNRYMIQNPKATYIVRVNGESMKGKNIHNNDVLVINRSVPPKSGDIVIAAHNGDLIVKELFVNGVVKLLPHNRKFKPIILDDFCSTEILGKVMFSITDHR